MRINEFIHIVKRYDFTVRVWAQTESLKDMALMASQRDQIESVTSNAVARESINTMVEVAEGISKLEFCNAVEVTPSGIAYSEHGVLIYPNWP